MSRTRRALLLSLFALVPLSGGVANATMVHIGPVSGDVSNEVPPPQPASWRWFCDHPHADLMVAGVQMPKVDPTICLFN